MTPKPPSSSEGSHLPPPRRPRPGLGKLVKDTSETELWAFDEPQNTVQPARVSSRPTSNSLPTSRDKQDPLAAKEPKKRQPVTPAFSPPPMPMPHEDLTINAGNREKSSRPDRQLSTPSRFGNDFSDFEDLDAWEDDAEMTSPEPSLRVVAPVPERMPVSADSSSLDSVREMEGELPISAREEEQEADPASVVTPLDELPPQEKKDAPGAASLSPSQGLSKVERIGLIALFALLLGGGGAMYWHMSRVPKLAPLTTRWDFPIQGKHLKFLSADTYWRQPKTDEGVRRDTALVPVLTLSSSGGPATIRVLFRNEKGELVGDAVTRVFKAGSSEEIAATAGFDDVGMLAGYAAEGDKPWIAQVFEAPADKTTGADFKKVFEMALSTLRR